MPKATRREWTGLGVLALPCVLYSMDLSVLNLAIPKLTADLHPSASQMLWIVDIYGFLLAGFLITMGTLGDRIGRRRLLMIGAAAFGLTSILAAFSTSASMLIVSRALLGVAAATLSPSTLSLIRNMFLDDRERTFAIAIWVGAFSAGGSLGPLIGGLLLEHFWWGSVFLLAVPMMLLLLALGPLLLPEYRDPHAGRMDLLSVAMSISAVLAVIYGIKRMAEHGIGVTALLTIAIGIVIGTLFIRRQRTLETPLIDIKLFSSRVFRSALGINILGLFIAFGSFLFIAQYLQLVLGMGPLEAGLWTAPSGVAFALGSVLTPRLVSRFGASTVMTAGFLIAALGLGFITQIGFHQDLWVLLTGFFMFCLGLSPAAAVTTDLAMSSVPPQRAGAASGISETSFEFGGALGIAVLGSLITAIYRHLMAATPLHGVGQHALEGARHTLGTAVATASQLHSPAGAALLEAARHSYTAALQWTSGICLILAIAAAAMSAILIRPR